MRFEFGSLPGPSEGPEFGENAEGKFEGTSKGVGGTVSEFRREN